MASILTATKDVFASLLELTWSFFSTALELVEKTLHFFVSFLQEIVQLVVNFFRGLVDLAGGIFGFVLGELRHNGDLGQGEKRGERLMVWQTGNIVMLGVVSVAVFGFLQYQRSQGKQVTVGGKKVN